MQEAYPMACPLMVSRAPFFFVLPHLVLQGNNGKYTKREHANYAQGNGPCLTVVEAFEHQYKANNGEQRCGSEKGELHTICSLGQK
jgi:hypothetical protein